MKNVEKDWRLMRDIITLARPYNYFMECAYDKAYLLSHFQELRIIQPTLLFLHGLPHAFSSPQVLEQSLSLLGPIISIKTKFLSNNFYSAFLEFQYESSAALLILMLEGAWVENRSLRVFLGCTKFCPHFLKNHQCHLGNCKYAHYYYPQLTHHKDQVKTIDHISVAGFILSSQKLSLEQTLYSLYEYSYTSPLLSLGSHKLPMIMQQIGYGYPQQVMPIKQETIASETEDGEWSQIVSENYLIERKVQVRREVEGIKKEEDWEILEKEIGSQAGDLEEERNEGRSARIQQFLDGAERLLTKLIFQSSVFVY